MQVKLCDVTLTDERICFCCGKVTDKWDVITEGYICFECQEKEDN